MIYGLLAAAYLVLFAIGALLAQRSGWLTLENVLLLVILALLYDNGVLAIGKYIGESGWLKAIHLPRYGLHALITPLLILFAWRTLVNAKVRWASHSAAGWTFVALTHGLIIFDLVTEVRGITLNPVWKHGVLLYEKVNVSELPPIMIIGVVSTLFIASLIVWWKQKWPWYCIGILSMAMTPLINLLIETNAAHNIGEFILMTALLATKRYQDLIYNNSRANKR